MTYFACPAFKTKAGVNEILGPLPGTLKWSAPTCTFILNPILSAYAHHPLLTRAQEYHLFRKYNYLKWIEKPAEASEVRNEILGYNYRLVVSVWDKHNKHTKCKADFDDYIQNGILTLVRCVDGFDYRRGIKFVTYAYRSLLCSMGDLSRSAGKHYNRFVQLSQCESWEIEDFRENGDNTTSRLSVQADIWHAMESLPPRVREVLKWRFWDGLTYTAIGERRGVTKQAAHLAVQAALCKVGRHRSLAMARGRT